MKSESNNPRRKGVKLLKDQIKNIKVNLSRIMSRNMMKMNKKSKILSRNNKRLLKCHYK
jgi:hypothetical protein